MKIRYVTFTLLLCLAASQPVWSQTSAAAPRLLIPLDTTLVHLDTPALPTKGSTTYRIDLRAFGGHEGTAYTGVSAQYGFGNNWAGILRASLTGRKTFAVSNNSGDFIRHGGSDMEIVAKYRFRNRNKYDDRTTPDETRVAGLIGIAIPDTAAQSDALLTLGVTAATPLGTPEKGITGYVNPRAVFIKSNTLFGLGLGVRARLGESTALVADITPLLAGQNTRSTSDGSRERRSIFGIALRYTQPTRGAVAGSVATSVSTMDGPPMPPTMTFDLGFATGTGTTTGYALTPGLGGSGAFFAALSYRR